MDDKQEVRPHTIRFPADLYQFIRDMAEREERPFNSQVIYLIKLGMGNVNYGKFTSSVAVRTDADKFYPTKETE